MEQLIELARQLGKQIASHQRTVLLREARKKLESDPEAKKLLADYHQHVEKIQTLERNQQPIEVADKHKLQELNDKIAAHEGLQELTRRHTDYIEMMRRVNQALGEQIET